MAAKKLQQTTHARMQTLLDTIMHTIDAGTAPSTMGQADALELLTMLAEELHDQLNGRIEGLKEDIRNAR